MFGQELNEQTYAIGKSDVLIMGEDANNIKLGSSSPLGTYKLMYVPQSPPIPKFRPKRPSIFG